MPLRLTAARPQQAATTKQPFTVSCVAPKTAEQREMAGVVGANGMMVGPGGAVGPLSAEGLHAVLLHTFTPDATQRKVSHGAPVC